MRKVVLYALLSLDGIAESPDRFVLDFDEEMFANLRRVIEAQDAVLLGRRTYDEWAEHWPGSDFQPFAGFINGVQKYVVTSTPLQASWARSTVIDESAPEFVRDLKKRSGGDIGIHGSIKLARSLFRSGVVDELQLVIAPAIAGDCERLFEGKDELHRLELLNCVGTPSGALLVHYRVQGNA
jgi:dihydrofolate reductase